MSASPPGAAAAALPTARVTLACRDLQEFLKDFLPRYRARGLFVAARRLLAVGDRLRVRVELMDGSVGFLGEALVTAQEPDGSCPGVRVSLDESPRIAPPPADPVPVARPPLPGEEPMARRLSLLADRLEALAVSALRLGDREGARAHCQAGIQADPRRASLRALLQQIEDPSDETGRPRPSSR